MANYIDNNRNTWFSLNKELKRLGNTPVKKNKQSLLQRKDRDESDNMLSTKQYMLTIRNAFKRNMEAEEEV